ncbi:MAG: hypothetical protein WBE18_01545 [Gammaproteobacteria bacterium]
MADYGEIAEAAAELGLEVALLAALASVQSDYNDLATNYFTLYQIQRDFYFSNFQIAGEAPFASEQFGIAFYTPDYTGTFHTGYFPPGAWYLFNPTLTGRIAALGSVSVAGYWQGYASRYSISSLTLDSSSYAMDLASTNDDWNSYMNRYEEHKRDVFNERRWANQMGSLSYGVKEAYMVERGLATSFEVFDKAQGQLISEESTMANGLATFAGYRQMQTALRRDLGTIPEQGQNSFLANVIPNG